MAPLIHTPETFAEMVIPRQVLGGGYDCDSDGNNCNDYSSWDNWGRWVALVVIVVFFIILGFLLSFLTNRHRRRIGRGPVPGTAWVPYVNGMHGNAPPAYGQHNYPQNNYPMTMPHGDLAPPKYAGQAPPVDAQQTGTTFTGEPGYYGNHVTSQHQSATSGADVQPPANVYTSPGRTEETYAPPTGPPPAKEEKK